jgi:hypothetical protein
MKSASGIATDLFAISYQRVNPAALPGFAPGVHWGLTLLLLGVCAVVVFTAGAAVGIRARTSAPVVDLPQSPPPATPASSGPSVETLAAQRGALVTGCLKVHGLLDDQVLAGVLDDALRRGGITAFDPTGQPLDPVRHRVDHTVAAPEPGADGVIAETLAAGYVDDGRVLRPAEVVVYQWGRS